MPSENVNQASSARIREQLQQIRELEQQNTFASPEQISANSQRIAQLRISIDNNKNENQIAYHGNKGFNEIAQRTNEISIAGRDVNQSRKRVSSSAATDFRDFKDRLDDIMKEGYATQILHIQSKIDAIPQNTQDPEKITERTQLQGLLDSLMASKSLWE